MSTIANRCSYAELTIPGWVPEAVQRYLLHTETGLSIRQVARSSGCHASTVLRQVRRFESRRDDPLIDEALYYLGRTHFQNRPSLYEKEMTHMNPAQQTSQNPDQKIEFEARRVLRRLSETGSVLAVGKDMEKAVVIRDLPGGKSTRTAVIDRDIAQAMALKDWIYCKTSGRVSQYEITTVGKSALKRMQSEIDKSAPGFHDAQAVFSDQHRVWGEKKIATGEDDRPRQIRYNIAESPLALLARRKDKTGKPFLCVDLVTTGERLREDFELAQMGPRVGQNWEKFLTGGDRGSFNNDGGIGNGPTDARTRVQEALAALGPGLGDVALRCCCYLEGLETAEKRMGWSARSGKIVLRIALQRLKLHYEERHGRYGPMIG